jgi:hypothetical protein
VDCILCLVHTSVVGVAQVPATQTVPGGWTMGEEAVGVKVYPAELSDQSAEFFVVVGASQRSTVVLDVHSAEVLQLRAHTNSRQEKHLQRGMSRDLGRGVERSPVLR